MIPSAVPSRAKLGHPLARTKSWRASRRSTDGSWLSKAVGESTARTGIVLERHELRSKPANV